MANRRTTFWLVFFGAAAALALIPEFFEEPVDDVVQPAPQPAPQVAPRPPEPEPRRGQLAELRSPAIAAAGRAGVPAPSEAAAAGAAARPPAARRAGTASAPLVDLFAAHSWQPPPPPPVAAPPAAPPPVAAPAAPVAPPLPFQYFGKLDDSRRLLVFLVRGERIFTVGEGDVVDGAYLIKSITDSQMTLVYLPLNLAQTLAVGSKL